MSKPASLPKDVMISETELPFTGLNQPDGVAVDTAGNVYVVDLAKRVLKLPAGCLWLWGMIRRYRRDPPPSLHPARCPETACRERIELRLYPLIYFAYRGSSRGCANPPARRPPIRRSPPR
jgi:hypothetical protein